MTTQLHIQTALRQGRTVLAKAYASSPLRLVNITENRLDGHLLAMLMSSSPGILDGDDYRLLIEVNDGCRLQLDTQSYQRLYTMAGAGATQHTTVHLGHNATFSFLPHPLVPHIDSKFTAHSAIHLGRGASLAWGEVVTCGRKLNGEQFLFDRLHLLTEVWQAGKLLIRENLFVAPADSSCLGMGLWEGFSHNASLLLLGPTIEPALHTPIILLMLAEQKDVLSGVSQVPCGGLVVRVLGNKAEQLHGCFKSIVSAVLPIHLPNALGHV